MRNKDEYSWLITLCDRANENKGKWRRAKQKTYRQTKSTNKIYEEAVIESETRTAFVQLKSEA